MNYFDYKPNEQMGRVWSLFDELGDRSEEKVLSSGLQDYAHTLEIVKAALSGSICLSGEGVSGFNLKAYEYACRENDRVLAKKNTQKELYIVDSAFDNEEERVGFGDISEARLKRLDDDFDEMLANSDLEINILNLLNIRNDIIVEEGIDVVQLLHSALSGVKDSMEILTKMIKRNRRLSDMVESICDTADHDVLMGRLSACMGGAC